MILLRRIFRSFRFSAGALFACVALMFSATAFPQSNSIGVVVPADAAAGQMASGSVVLNPQDWGSAAGVKIYSGKLPSPAGPLTNYLVRVGGGPPQPANQPFSFQVAPSLPLHLMNAAQPNTELLTIPLTFPAMPTLPSQKFEGYYVPPVALGGALQSIYGPFGGDCRQAALAELGTHEENARGASPKRRRV